MLVTAELTQLLHDVLTSRVYDVARETALDPAPRLSERLGNEVLLKREDLQPIFSFKIRGAYNKVAHLTERERARGIIAASAGNHAQGVAFSAKQLKLRAVIVMPQTTPQIKVDAVRALGAEVVLSGDSYADAKAHCDTLAEQSGMTFINPFDDPLVIAGQGTVGAEILQHTQDRLSAVFVPVGGGGLIAGIAGYIKALRPDVIGRLGLTIPEIANAISQQNQLTPAGQIGGPCVTRPDRDLHEVEVRHGVVRLAYARRPG